jgi:hypothetical protein
MPAPMMALRVKLVRDQSLDLAAQPAPIADEAVVHEQPLATSKGMAIDAGDRRAGRGTDMGEEQVRLQVPAQVAQVLVRPGRPDLAIEARLGVIAAVPAKAEAVAVDAGGRLKGVDTLRNQRMRRLGDVVLERSHLSAICNPAAHKN